MRVVVPIALVAVHFALAAPVQARGRGVSWESLDRAAKKACLTGDYKKGIEILADLFVESGDLNYVYNQGRCFEQNHRWEEALDRFLEFQRKTLNPSAREKRDIEKHIAECKSHLAEQTPAAPSPAPPPAAAAAATPVALAESSLPPPPAPTVSLAMTPAQSTEDRQGSGLRVAGIAAGVLGLAGITTGVVLAMKTGTLTDEINKQYNRDKAATRDSYETWGWISYGVGAAALVTGATLFVIEWRSGKSQPGAATVSVLPMLAPGGAALYVRGAY
jgi:hypothetical protein